MNADTREAREFEVWKRAQWVQSLKIDDMALIRQQNGETFPAKVSEVGETVVKVQIREEGGFVETFCFSRQTGGQPGSPNLRLQAI